MNYDFLGRYDIIMFMIFFRHESAETNVLTNIT